MNVEEVDDAGQTRLFSRDELHVTPEEHPEPPTDTGANPVWTDNKARFIMLYLKYFVYITKHGTYIDGFAGPQAERQTNSWAAKLVLESRPRWIRHLYLCDAKPQQVTRLHELKAAQPARDEKGRRIYRDIEIYEGDFNIKVDEILGSGKIGENEATFCLLDQRTFECEWSTLEKLARYKKGNKIELFYFLANSWLDRALSGQRKVERLARWWGRDDWGAMKNMSREQRRDVIVNRIKSEFGYKSVKAYRIFKRADGGAIMYYMIHATDHEEGPFQMSRAYRNTVRPDPPEGTQMDLFEIMGPEPQSPPTISQMSA